MLALRDEKVLLEYFGSTGFITLKEGNRVYLVDTRFHKCVLLFPHLTYLTTLKLYDVTNVNVRAPIFVELEGKNELMKQASIFGISLGLIVYGQNVLPISNNIIRWIVVIFTICLYLYKYISHISFLTKLGNKYNFIYSDLKTVNAKIKFNDSKDQRKYSLQVLGYCFGDILFLLLTVYCLWQRDSFIMLGSIILMWVYILILPISKLMTGKKHLEFENEEKN